MDAYHTRPPYQQNDYIGWIDRAKQDATKQKRLNQMLDELRKGDVYMTRQFKVYSNQLFSKVQDCKSYLDWPELIA